MIRTSARKIKKGVYGKKEMDDWNKILLNYKKAAIYIVKKIDAYNKEIAAKGADAPIEHIKYRIKSQKSIEEKLKKYNKPFSPEAAIMTLRDIAGVRLICPFEKDIQKVVNYIRGQEDINIIKTKDYITYPKPSGYKSFHMIVSVNIDEKPVTVEIQIRTLAMDFWACMEHKIAYKKDDKKTRSLRKRLKKCAEQIAKVEKEMCLIRDEKDTPPC